MTLGEQIPLEQFFADRSGLARELFDTVAAAVETIGPATIRATKSQVAFRRRVAFAWTWAPEQYLSREGLAPLVLSVGLRRHDASPRWKQVVEASAGRFVHHLELHSEEEIDDEVIAWLREAWEDAA